MGTAVSSPAVPAGPTGLVDSGRTKSANSTQYRAGGGGREKQWWASAWVDTGEESWWIWLQYIWPGTRTGWMAIRRRSTSQESQTRRWAVKKHQLCYISIQVPWAAQHSEGFLVKGSKLFCLPVTFEDSIPRNKSGEEQYFDPHTSSNFYFWEPYRRYSKFTKVWQTKLPWTPWTTSHWATE